MSVRDYYYNYGSGEFHDDVIFRVDDKEFKNWSLIGELDLATCHLKNQHHYGLGDTFFQGLYTLKKTNFFAFAAGAATVLPTATSKNLGARKLQFAPAILGTIYPLGGERLSAALQLRDFISVASTGKSNFIAIEGGPLFSEPEGNQINFLEIKPSLKYKLSDRYELYALPLTLSVNWQNSNELSYQSAIRVSGMITDRLGAWIQPEVPFGSNSTGYFNLKVAVFYKY